MQELDHWSFPLTRFRALLLSSLFADIYVALCCEPCLGWVSTPLTLLYILYFSWPSYVDRVVGPKAWYPLVACVAVGRLYDLKWTLTTLSFTMCAFRLDVLDMMPVADSRWSSVRNLLEEVRRKDQMGALWNILSGLLTNLIINCFFFFHSWTAFFIVQLPIFLCIIYDLQTCLRLMALWTSVYEQPRWTVG